MNKGLVVCVKLQIPFLSHREGGGGEKQEEKERRRGRRSSRVGLIVRKAL